MPLEYILSPRAGDGEGGSRRRQSPDDTCGSRACGRSESPSIPVRSVSPHGKRALGLRLDGKPEPLWGLRFSDAIAKAAKR